MRELEEVQPELPDIKKGARILTVYARQLMALASKVAVKRVMRARIPVSSRV